jgi:hypothetical protein
VKKPWTIRLKALGSAKPVGPIAYAIDGDLPRYWTRWGAKRAAHALNSEASHHRNYLWVAARTRRKPW